MSSVPVRMRLMCGSPDWAGALGLGGVPLLEHGAKIIRAAAGGTLQLQRSQRPCSTRVLLDPPIAIPSFGRMGFLRRTAMLKDSLRFAGQRLSKEGARMATYYVLVSEVRGRHVPIGRVHRDRHDAETAARDINRALPGVRAKVLEVSGDSL